MKGTNAMSNNATCETPTITQSARGSSPGRPNLSATDGTVVDVPEALEGFFRAVEREMRMPIAALIAASEMLAEQLGPDHPGSGYARLIRRESDRIREMTADLASLTMPLRPDLRPADLAPVLSLLVPKFAPAARQNSVRLFADIPPGPLTAKSNPEAVRAALSRIIEYQIEAMPNGGTLVIAAGFARSAARRTIWVRFADRGPIIPRELIPKIFDAFAAIPGRPSGMGLAVCRRIIEHCAGTITARNNPAGGLAIEVRLPSETEESPSEKGELR